MGYDFICDGAEFRWSSGNWRRVLNLAGVDEKEYMAQTQTLEGDKIKTLAVGLAKAIGELKFPDMSIRDYWNDEIHPPGMEGDVITQENVWAFIVPHQEKPVFITEDDPRWQGMFFQHLGDFVFYLQGAYEENRTIQIS